MSANEEVFLKHRDELVRYATVLVGPDAAPDVVSTVVTKVSSSRRSLGDLREPRPYLMRGVLNESIRYRDKSHRQHAVGLPVTAKASRPEVLDVVVTLPPTRPSNEGHSVQIDSILLPVDRGVGCTD